MTVSSSLRSAGPFVGNGVTVSFPFAFKVFDKNDLEVTHTDAAGVQTVLTLDSDYSVALNVDQEASPGGSIEYPMVGSPLAADETLSAISIVPYTQEMDIANAGSFLPQVLEDALDRIVMLVQQVFELFGRTIRFPVGDTANPILPTAVLRANTVLQFDAEGNAGVSADYLGQVAAAASAAANSATSAAASAAAAAASIGSVDGSVYYSTTDAGPTWTIPVPFITFTGAFIGGLKYRPSNFVADPVAGTVTLTSVPITEFETGTLVDLHFVPA